MANAQYKKNKKTELVLNDQRCNFEVFKLQENLKKVTMQV